MATFHFDLVSPEKLAFSGEVDQVDVPGAEGDFGVLAGHAPVVAAIRPGILTVMTGGTKEKIIVFGGLAEVSEKGLTVLADVATSIEELDRAKFAETIAEMEAKLAEKEGSELDHAVERLDHFKSIQNELQTDGDALSPGSERTGALTIRTYLRRANPHPPRIECGAGFRSKALRPTSGAATTANNLNASTTA